MVSSNSSPTWTGVPSNVAQSPPPGASCVADCTSMLVASAGQESTSCSRTYTTGPTRPAFPQVSKPDVFRVRLRRFVHPKQFQVSVAKEEATTGRALSGMTVGRAFGQPERRQTIRFRSANGNADEEMIEMM